MLYSLVQSDSQMRRMLRSLASQIGCRSSNRGIPTVLLLLTLICAHDVGSEELLRDGTDSFSHSRDQRRSAGPSDLENTSCYKHKTCSECLQDPCSRYLALNGHGNGSDICIWCTQMRDGGNEGLPKDQACLPRKLAHQSYCLTEHTSADTCNSSVELKIKEEKRGRVVCLRVRGRIISILNSVVSL